MVAVIISALIVCGSLPGGVNINVAFVFQRAHAAAEKVR